MGSLYEVSDNIDTLLSLIFSSEMTKSCMLLSSTTKIELPSFFWGDVCIICSTSLAEFCWLSSVGLRGAIFRYARRAQSFLK
jgi:hypothetical protein